MDCDNLGFLKAGQPIRFLYFGEEKDGVVLELIDNWAAYVDTGECECLVLPGEYLGRLSLH